MRKPSMLHRGWVLVLAAFLALGLASCAQQEQGSDSGSAPSETSAGTQGGSELYGSPWITSVFTGNLPDAAPDAADDLYLHYAYDYAAAHQDADYASVTNDAQGEVEAAITATIKDEAVASPELEQLRIFYNQATDFDALEAAGSEELKPFLKAVADTQSLDELEAVLLSDDFPFSPWIETTISAPNTKSTMCAAIFPSMLFTNEETSAVVYQESDDEHTQAAYDLMASQKRYIVSSDLTLISIAKDADQAEEITANMFNLEKSYGKYEDANKYLNAEYGAQTEAIKVLTLDELEAACPNFPMRETLAKLGEDTGDKVIVMYPEWLSAFNDVWVEENFELLRAMTEEKILNECAPYLAPSFFASQREALGVPDQTPDEFAYSACDRTKTFAQLLAKTYVEQTLGTEAVEDLERLTNDLIDSYIVLIGDTPWLNEQTRENVIDKIDNMALNILYPEGGYFDYSGLKLIPTDEGGTLLSNYFVVKAYNDKLKADLIGQPARAIDTWLYVRPTIQNCFYDSMSNSINIFPGCITSATYTKGMSTEELLAGMGFNIGHEISHAFDYSGSQFNAYGEPIAIFTDADVQKFVAKRQAIADYYSTIEIMPGITVDGMSKSSEATADLCGMQVVLERARGIEGFDYEKMFGCCAYDWAVVYSPVYADYLQVDPHPLDNLRVNVNAQMFDEFYSTFGATEGNTMYLAPENRLAMWGKNS